MEGSSEVKRLTKDLISGDKMIRLSQMRRY
jgi:hypothetical protein